MVETEYECTCCIYKGIADLVVQIDYEIVNQYKSDLALLPEKIKEWEAKCEEQVNLYESFKVECIEHNNALTWPKILRNK